jgi:hypothetical protein
VTAENAPIKNKVIDEEKGPNQGLMSRPWIRWCQEIVRQFNNFVATIKYDDLTDTPNSKTGESLKVVRVNAGETAHEYTDVGSLGIDHLTDIANVGTNTHAQIDTHIADTSIHNPYSGIVTVEYDEVVPTFTGNLETSRVYKLATSTVMTLTFTYDTSDRIATVSNGTNTWTYPHSGTGFLSGGVKT